jgi:hypothetical protein
LTTDDACELCGWRADGSKVDAGWRGAVAGAAAAARSAAQSVLAAAGAGASPDGDPTTPTESAFASEPAAATIEDPNSDPEVTGPFPSANNEIDDEGDCPQPGTATTKVNLADAAKVGGIGIINGKDGLLIGTVNIVQERDPETGGERLRALLEITKEFHPDQRVAGSFTAAEVAAHSRRLAEDGLLLVDCVDPSLARAAAHAVVASLSPGPERARLLTFHEQTALTIHMLVRAPDQKAGETVIVADARNRAGQTFLDSLLNDHAAFSAAEFKRALRDRKRMLLCLTLPDSLDAADPAPDQDGFARWSVPFLDAFLRREFPGETEEIRQALLEQREQGRWSQHDATFYKELYSLAARGELRATIDKGGRSTARQVADVSDERPVHQAVFFVGAFFTGLAPADFSLLVTLLLGDAAEATPLPPPASSEVAPTAVHRLRPLAEVWIEGADRIKDACGLAVLPDRAGCRVVEFEEPGARERLRDRLEHKYPFYLQRMLATVREHQLLFADSEALAAGVIAFIADMVESYPETYDEDWLAALVVSGRAALPQAPRRVGLRCAEVLRELWARPSTRALIDGVLERLLRVRRFDEVLELVRRLRFAPGFDHLPWLRQLIDRGNEVTRSAAYRFLYRDLTAPGSRVYPTLHALAEWLPAEDRDVGTYSPSNRRALQLMLEYAADTAARFDPQAYGEWPVRYPLLASEGGADRARDLPLLVRWLLHPGIPGGALEGVSLAGVPRLIAALVAEWTFILFGPHRAPAADQHVGPADGAEQAFTRLLSELATRTATPAGRAIRGEMLEYWDEMRLCLVPTSRMTREQRTELVWKRALFSVIQLRFRPLARAAAQAPDRPERERPT